MPRRHSPQSPMPEPTAAVVDTQLADIPELAWSDEDAETVETVEDTENTENTEIVSHSWATTFTKAGLMLGCGLVVVGVAVSVVSTTGSGISPTPVPTTSVSVIPASVLPPPSAVMPSTVTVPAAPPPTVTVQAAPLPTVTSTPGCEANCPSVYDQDFLTRMTTEGWEMSDPAKKLILLTRFAELYKPVNLPRRSNSG